VQEVQSIKKTDLLWPLKVLNWNRLLNDNCFFKCYVSYDLCVYNEG